MPQKKAVIVRIISLCLFIFFLTLSCNKGDAADKTDEPGKANSAKVTFIELGSVNCVPCRMMKPVMEKLEENFPKDLEVVFYDVWTQEQRVYAQEFRIRVIPTQVFLDEKGEEFFRHEGFFPYEQVVEVLKQKGVEG